MNSSVCDLSNSVLLGRPRHDLALRLSNSVHQGRIVPLVRTKSTIGSGPHCTLRLRQPGVAPVHCLILRGRDQTVVRSWNDSTRLNDHPFVDAPLRAGDRLGIGPLEWEVIDASEFEAPGECKPSELAADSAAEAARLADLQQQLDAEAAALAQFRRQLEQDRERVKSEAAAALAHREAWQAEQTTWLAERAAADAAIADQKELIADEKEALTQQILGLNLTLESAIRERQQLESGQQQLVGERQQLAALRKSLENELTAAELIKQELRSERQALERERLEFQSNAHEDGEAERAALGAERQQVARDRQTIEESRLTNHAERLQIAAERDAVEAERESLRMERQTLDVQVQGLVAERQMIASQRQSLEMQEQRLISEQQSSETMRQIIESARRDLESQQTQLKTETEQSSRRMAEQQAALTAAQKSFQRQCDQWQIDRDELQAEIALELELCQQQLAEVNRIRQDFDRERADWDALRQAKESDLAARRESLEQQTAELERQAQLLEQRVSVATAGSPSGEARGPATESFAVGRTVADAPEMESQFPAIADSEADDARRDEEVFARLRTYSLVKGADCGQDQSIFSDAIERDRTSAGQPIAAEEPVHSAAAADDEESIDDYMARLLNRIGGSSPSDEKPVARPASRAVAPQTLPPPREIERRVLTTEVAPELERRPIQPSAAPVQLVARSAPPELGVDLKAMRELANLTTRGAIDKHAHGRWSRMAVGKIVGGSLSLLSGVWLTFFLGNSFSWIARIAGIAGMGAGGFWILQGAMLVRNVRTATRRANSLANQDSAALDPNANVAQLTNDPLLGPAKEAPSDESETGGRA